MPLHVIGLTDRGRVFHTERTRPNPVLGQAGGWSDWVNVTDKTGNQNASPLQIDCTVVSNILSGTLYIFNFSAYTFRDSIGNWQPWTTIPTSPGTQYHDGGVTGLNNALHVVELTSTFSITPPNQVTRLKYAIGASNPISWQPWQTINEPPQISVLSASKCTLVNVADQLHLCLLDNSNQLWHMGPGIVPNALWVNVIPQAPGNITSFAAAGVGNNLHICIVVNNKLYHTIKTLNGWENPEGSSNPFWGDVTGAVSNIVNGGTVGNITNVACAGIGDDLHICCIVDTGNGATKILHTIRNAKSVSWQNPENSKIAQWGDVTATVQGFSTTAFPGEHFTQVALAGFLGISDGEIIGILDGDLVDPGSIKPA